MFPHFFLFFSFLFFLNVYCKYFIKVQLLNYDHSLQRIKRKVKQENRRPQT
jgi:hypothetical protein